MKNNYYKRLARVEAMANSNKAELMETLQEAYIRACNEQDEESASEYARKIRNKLLEEADARMIIDRMGLEVPQGNTFADWLTFLQGLGNALAGEWALYRQTLRDIPEQVGFPFNVDFPTPPEE